MKIFLEREMLNTYNEKDLVKTIGYKLLHKIYGSTITAIANLILLVNIGPRVKLHLQLLSSLVLWSYRKKITYATYYKRGSLRQQRTENQAFILLHLQADQFRKSFTPHAVSLNN